MQNRTKEQREKEEVQIISSIDHNGQESHLQLQHLSVWLFNHKARQRFKQDQQNRQRWICSVCPTTDGVIQNMEYHFCCPFIELIECNDSH